MTILTVLVATIVSFADDSKGLELLKEKGLKASAGFYIVPEETTLSKGLSDLRAIERTVNLAQKAFAQFEKQRVENDQIITQLRNQNRQLRDQLERARNNVELYNRIINQLNNNQEEMANRTKASVDPESGKEARAKLSKARDQYMQKVLALRAAADGAKKKYEELAGDKTVKDAIETANKEFEKEYELGPSKAFANNVKALEKLESKVLSESIQLRNDANTWRIDVVLNGKGPMPMVFDTGASSISLPASMAAEIGLTPSADAPKVQVRIANGDMVTATRATIDTVRVGQFEAADVECLIMPAELRDVPPLLGGAFINRFNYKMDPDTGKLTLTKLGGEEEPKSTKKTSTKTSTKKSKKP
jgi:clan AA aspartic protease (TIGR02281 family)